MTTLYKTINNPRVIVIQKIYGKLLNKEENLVFKKHRFKKFINLTKTFTFSDDI